MFELYCLMLKIIGNNLAKLIPMISQVLWTLDCSMKNTIFVVQLLIIKNLFNVSLIQHKKPSAFLYTTIYFTTVLGTLRRLTV